MIRTFFGIASGLYIGTYYDIKPQFETILRYIKDNFPKDK
jgi:hypothetical protein